MDTAGRIRIQTVPGVTKTLSVLQLGLVVMFVAVTESVHYYHSIAGPFKINIRRIEACPAELQSKTVLTFFVKDMRTKYDQDLRYDGNLTLPFALNNGLSARMILASYNNVAGWRDNAHVFHVDRICHALDTFIPNAWFGYLRSIYGEVPHAGGDCNYLPGLFSASISLLQSFKRFSNWTINWNDIPVKHFFYNRWRADLQILRPNKETAACVRGYADTVPK